MTIPEVQAVMATLESEYPHSFRGLRNEHGRAKMALWCDALANDDSSLVWAAIRAIMTAEDREFAPTLAHIKAKMHELSTPPSLDEGKAWDMVVKACKNGLYGAESEFRKLPPEVQAAVGSPAQIKAWAQVDTNELQTVIGSNFRRSYRTAVQRRRDREMLPPSVLRLVAEATQSMALPKPKD